MWVKEPRRHVWIKKGLTCTSSETGPCAASSAAGRGSPCRWGQRATLPSGDSSLVLVGPPKTWRRVQTRADVEGTLAWHTLRVGVEELHSHTLRLQSHCQVESTLSDSGFMDVLFWFVIRTASLFETIFSTYTRLRHRPVSWLSLQVHHHRKQKLKIHRDCGYNQVTSAVLLASCCNFSEKRALSWLGGEKSRRQEERQRQLFWETCQLHSNKPECNTLTREWPSLPACVAITESLLSEARYTLTSSTLIKDANRKLVALLMTNLDFSWSYRCYLEAATGVHFSGQGL